MMRFCVHPSTLHGEVVIPGSKSHTIRALVFGLLADGESVIRSPLDSSDTRACLAMVKNLGAAVEEKEDLWRVRGVGGRLEAPADVVDVGNSGTSLYIGLGVASLAEGYTVFTGDHQIRSRPAAPLLRSLADLGVFAVSTRGNGMPPIIMKGRLRGGKTSLEAHTSQYLSSLLVAAPLAAGDAEITVPLLNEAPYVEMTLAWQKKLGIDFAADGLRRFEIKGNQRYRRFDESIPADFSSATFFLVAAAVTGSELVLRGLDYTDTQGDKKVVEILQQMGAEIDVGERHITVMGGALRGGVFDLNDIPDALPALSVAACFADGETRLVNVPQARLKETDRISVMRDELAKMGADVAELPDGLVIRGSDLSGASVDGHGDHRVVMALAVAGLAAKGVTEITTAESVAVTFPGFEGLLRTAGADITTLK